MSTLTLKIGNLQQLQHGVTTHHRFDHSGGTIGSQGADWLLIDADQAIEPIHCEIRWIEGTFCAIDRCARTYLNDSPRSLGPRAPVRLQEGDQLSIGAYRLHVRSHEHPANAGSLEVLFASGQGALQALVAETAAWPGVTERPEAHAASDICEAFEPGIGRDPLAALDAALHVERTQEDTLQRLIAGANS
ncbi:MAG: FHA domain-containing protein [Pseudomonas sp.]